MLSWLTYRQDGKTCVLVEVGDVIQARLKGDVAHNGIDAHFVRGLILDEAHAALVPADLVGRLMTDSGGARAARPDRGAIDPEEAACAFGQARNRAPPKACRKTLTGLGDSPGEPEFIPWLP